MSRRFRICMAKGGRESLRPSYGRPKLTLISREKNHLEKRWIFVVNDYDVDVASVAEVDEWGDGDDKEGSSIVTIHDVHDFR